MRQADDELSLFLCLFYPEKQTNKLTNTFNGVFKNKIIEILYIKFYVKHKQF